MTAELESSASTATFATAGVRRFSARWPSWFVGWPADVRRFIAVTACFWAPVLALVALCEVLLWRVGETLPVAQVLDRQLVKPGKFLRQASQDFYSYKYYGIKRTTPRTLILGSSRVMEFRAEMFGIQLAQPPWEFYNAGGLIENLQDLEDFADKLEAMPHV